jgi:hypothetical protein
MKRTQLHCACFFFFLQDTEAFVSVQRNFDLLHFQLVSPPHLKEKQSKAKRSSGGFFRFLVAARYFLFVSCGLDRFCYFAALLS